jgi:hypothetical protein
VNVYLFAMQKHLLDAAFSRVDDAAAKEVASKSLIPAQCTRAITRIQRSRVAALIFWIDFRTRVQIRFHFETNRSRQQSRPMLV